MTVGRGGGCAALLDIGRTAFRTSLPLQKKDPLELAPGGVIGRSVNLGFSGVLSSYALLGRSGGSGACTRVLLGLTCSGGFTSKGAASVSLVRTLVVLLEPPPLGSLFSIFL